MAIEEKRLVNISKCARCGYDHADLEFRKFEIPIVDSDGSIWNWWALCKTNGEPILLKIIESDKNGH